MATAQVPKEKQTPKPSAKPVDPVQEPQEYLLQFFEYGHLPPHMQDTSKHFHDLALIMISTLPRNPERTMALRRLLEALDCAKRAKVFRNEA